MLITKQEVLKLRSLYIMSVDHQTRSVKVAEFKYYELMTKEEVLKVQSLYIMC